jgi:hypothetical protein
MYSIIFTMPTVCWYYRAHRDLLASKAKRMVLMVGKDTQRSNFESESALNLRDKIP